MAGDAVTDLKLERMIAVLLRTGVLAAGSVVLAGGVLYLARHGGESVDYRHFVPLAAEDRLLGKIAMGAVALRARAVIQVGVLLLIATPILRVALAVVGFALERDKQYVWIAGLVLGLLFFSLLSGTW